MSALTDPISDFLTRLRNASRAQKHELSLPFSIIKNDMARVLKQEGYIADFAVEGDGATKSIKVTTRFVEQTPAISGLKRVSRPACGVTLAQGRFPGCAEARASPSSRRRVACERSRGQAPKRRRRITRLRLLISFFPLQSPRKQTPMSRIGNKSIDLPDKVKINLGNGGLVSVEGPKGKLSYTLPRTISAKSEGASLLLPGPTTSARTRRCTASARSLVANMVTGVSTGYLKDLEIQGVGFKAAVQGDKLNLSLGKSHPILFPIPTGIKITVTENTKVRVEGIDKQVVGQVAANIRGYYPPEPYKGQGRALRRRERPTQGRQDRSVKF